MRVGDQWTSGGSWYVERKVMGDLSDKIRTKVLAFGSYVTANYQSYRISSVTAQNSTYLKHVQNWQAFMGFQCLIQNLFRMKGKGLKERILANRQLNALSMMKKAAKEPFIIH